MRLASLVLFLALGSLASAQEKPDSPKPNSVAQERAANKPFWIASAAMAGSSAGPLIGGHICRANNGVEPCITHYGEYHAWQTFNSTANAIVWPSLFYLCRKETGNGKWCWVIPPVVIGYNIGLGIHEARIHNPEIAGQSAVRKMSERDLDGKR